MHTVTLVVESASPVAYIGLSRNLSIHSKVPGELTEVPISHCIGRDFDANFPKRP